LQRGESIEHARIVDAPGTRLEWVLPSDAEARSHPPCTLEPSVSRERELEIAWTLAEQRVQRAIESKKSSDICSALSDAAWIDPALVLGRLEEGALDGFLADVVRARVVDALMKTSPDDAALVSGLQQPFARAMDLVRIADSLPADARERKLELLSEAAVAAPHAGAPEYELVTYARIAKSLVDLGERDEARKFIERGLPLVDKLPAQEWPGYARSCFAEALAPFDLDRALAIVAEQKDSMEHERHYGNIAHRLAASDPAGAERAWKAFKGETHGFAADWLSRVCYAMATSDLARARRLALEGGGREGAFALGMMALRITTNDRATAADLLEQAFRILTALAARDVNRGEATDYAIVGAALLPVV